MIDKPTAREIVRAVAALKKRGGCTFGQIIMLNNSTSALVEVHSKAAQTTVAGWFNAVGAQVIRIDTTNGACIIEFRESFRKERT